MLFADAETAPPTPDHVEVACILVQKKWNDLHPCLNTSEHECLPTTREHQCLQQGITRSGPSLAPRCFTCPHRGFPSQAGAEGYTIFQGRWHARPWTIDNGSTMSVPPPTQACWVPTGKRLGGLLLYQRLDHNSAPLLVPCTCAMSHLHGCPHQPMALIQRIVRLETAGN